MGIVNFPEKTKEDLITYLTNDSVSLKIGVIVHIQDFMKLTNTYGIEFGRNIIKELSVRLSTVFDKKEIYKIKSNEFLLCKKVENSPSEDINEIKKQVLALVKKDFNISDVVINIKTYIGFAMATGVNILKYADIALEEAKISKKLTCIFSESLLKNKPTTESNIFILKQIQAAIKEKKVFPHYQPIINNRSGKCYKYEALVRIKDYNGDFISPACFIELTKVSNDYPQITKSMIERVFFDFSKRPDDKVSINLSFRDIESLEIRKFIKEKIHMFPFPENIIFEIVESEEVHDFRILNDFVNELKEVNSNIGIAIDDFGTGFSNYININSINADFIKIDGVLIKDIMNPKTYDLIKSICDFASSNDIKIIAEYVESEDIFNRVKELGIDYSQGYLFSKPLDISELKVNNFKKIKG